MRSPIISKLYSVLWPLAILILPWQTRWIFAQGSIGSYPWEQGTLCVYASWILLLLAAGFGFAVAGWERIKSMCNWKHAKILAIAVALLILPAIMTSSWHASFMWWAQAIILTLFIWSLVAVRISFARAASWFLISLIPEMILGFVQYINQDVSASSWLGIAEQHPWVHGTSVVEHGLYRVLRAYAGFPHPNIFGGWLAIALVLIPMLIPAARYRYRPFLAILAALFSFVLVLTFSRSAWLATAIGFAVAAIAAFFSSSTSDRKTAVILFSIAAIGSGLLGVYTQWDHVNTRLQNTETLELLSEFTRSQALREGIDAWKKRPLFGWGEGATNLGIAEVRKTTPFLIPLAPEPPHVAPLAALVDIGVVGILGAVLLAAFLLLASIRRQTISIKGKSITIPYPDPLILTLIALACIDHYLWTTWSGQALLAMVVGLVVLRSGNSVKED
ncbi:MAG: O-antigen ligase family protein [Patescibacteria group bacterium]